MATTHNVDQDWTAEDHRGEVDPLVRELRAALELALPYVERIAATNPTEYHRNLRQLQAVKDAKAIRAAIAKVEG